MSTTTSLRHRIASTTTLALGAAAIAVGAFAMGAPAANAAPSNGPAFKQTCEQSPGLYDAAALRGVYSAQRSGNDLEHKCTVYGANDRLLGRHYAYDYGWFLNPKNQRPEAVIPPLASR